MPRILIVDRNIGESLANELRPYLPLAYEFEHLSYPYQALQAVRENLDTPYRAIIASMELPYKRPAEHRSGLDGLSLALVLKCEGYLKKTAFLLLMQRPTRAHSRAAATVGIPAFSLPQSWEQTQELVSPLRQSIMQNSFGAQVQEPPPAY